MNINKKDLEFFFNQYLYHHNGINCSNKSRATMQLRFNDLETMKKVTSSFTSVNSHL